MKEIVIKFMPYGIALGIDFYVLPLLAGSTGAAMLLLLCVMPLAALVTAVIFGVRRGCSAALPILALVLFIPTIFIHYNASAWIYAVIYAGIVLVGMTIGKAFYGKR